MIRIVGKSRERDKDKQNGSMIWDPLIPTFTKKALSVAVIWRVVTDGWSITKNGFLGERSYHFKQKEKLTIITFNC